MTDLNKEEISTKSPDIEEPPPFGKSWKSLYRIVFLNLLALILIFYLISKTLS